MSGISACVATRIDQADRPLKVTALVVMVFRARLQNEQPIAVRTLHLSSLAHFEINFGMTQCATAAIA
jgi:hypothetical protein